jgi:hypothetical protein
MMFADPRGYVGSGRAVYDARWACWKACCGQPSPSGCQNPKLHQAIRELDDAWRELLAQVRQEPKP